MDLCVSGLDCQNNKMLEKTNLRKLTEAIQEWLPIGLIIKQTNIFETDFPVIKMVIDTSVLEAYHHIERIIYPEVTDEIPSISVDITIDDSSTKNQNHFGKNCWEYVLHELSIHH